MKFEEMLRRYRDGTATPEEQSCVEAELEKARAIESYLAEELPPIPEEPAAESATEYRQVRRKLNRRTRRLFLATIAAVAALLLLAQLVIFPAINGSIYRRSDTLSEFDTFMSVMTRLHIPGATYGGSWAENTGFGTQTIALQFWRKGAQPLSLSARLCCGQLGQLSGDVRELQMAGYHKSGDFWEHLTNDDAELLSDVRAQNEAWWSDLPEYVAVSAAVTFAQPLTMEEYEAFLNERWNGSLSVGAALVKTSSNINPIYLQVTPSGCSLRDLNEQYPEMEISSAVTAQTMQQHLESELQYMVDHPKLSHWLFEYSNSSGMGYGAMLQDIQQNGAQIQGVYVTGTPQAMLALQQDARIATVGASSYAISQVS
jgi:hypothetical protein